MVRIVDHQTRRRAVLSAAINRYIQDAAPVASEDIAADFDLSSATIRNIFAELEKTGYLMQPHTSSGRIPTDKGWRYYVDFLLSQTELMDEEKQDIVSGFKREINRLDDVLEMASGVISTITHYAGIVSFLEWEDKFFYRGISLILEQPEFHNFDRMRLLIKMLEDKQRLLNIINRDIKEKVKVYIGQELECAEMNNCALVVSGYSVKNRPLGRLAVLGPIRMDYDHIIPKLEYISDILTQTLQQI